MMRVSKYQKCIYDGRIPFLSSAGSPNAAAAAAVRVLPRPPGETRSRRVRFQLSGVEGESLGGRSCTTHVSTHFGYRGPSFRKASLCSAVLSGEEFRGRVFLFLFQLRVSFNFVWIICQIGLIEVFFLQEELLASSSVQRGVSADLLNVICGRYFFNFCRTCGS